MRRRLAESLHPGSWWILGLALALSASLSQNLTWLSLICVICIALAAALGAPDSINFSLKLYVGLAFLVVLTRLAFRIIFNFPDSSAPTSLDLPVVTINFGLGGVTTLLGPVSWASIQAATIDGFRLAAIILAVAMANTVANPKKLLKSTPAALYEVATAIVVSINLAPQLISSLQRVRRARAIRGRSRGVSTLAGTVIPALEDTIDASLALAASMDSRGFGRSGNMPHNRRLILRALTLLALSSAIIGIFLLLGSSAANLAVLISYSITGLAALGAVKVASDNKIRTRFRAQPWTARDYALIGICFGFLAISQLGGA